MYMFKKIIKQEHSNEHVYFGNICFYVYFKLNFIILYQNIIKKKRINIIRLHNIYLIFFLYYLYYYFHFRKFVL